MNFFIALLGETLFDAGKIIQLRHPLANQPTMPRQRFARATRANRIFKGHRP